MLVPLLHQQELAQEALRSINCYAPDRVHGSGHMVHDPDVQRQVLFTRAREEPLSPSEIASLKHRTEHSRPMTPAEYTALVKEVFSESFKRETLNLEDTTEDRIKVSWRIVREMARSKRLTQMDEPLIQSITTKTQHALCMWSMPTEINSTRDTDTSTDYLRKPDATTNPDLLHIYAEALKLRSDYWPWVLSDYTQLVVLDTEDDDDFFETTQTPTPTKDDPRAPQPFVIRAGLPLLPPPVPLKFHDDNGMITENYSTTRDPGLLLYMKAVDATARFLGIYQGSKEHPEMGRRGMLGLDSAYTIRLAFPTRIQIIAWEYIMINKTLRMLSNIGARKTYEQLHIEHGLHHMEVSGLIKMTKKFAKDLISADRAEDRSIMLIRCEDLMRRARGALDLKAEQNAMKQMSQIMGLTRTEEDETLGDFVEVVKNHTNKRMAEAQMKRASLPNPHEGQILLDDE